MRAIVFFRLALLAAALAGCSSFRPVSHPPSMAASDSEPREFVAGRCRLTLVSGEQVVAEDLWIGPDSVRTTRVICTKRGSGGSREEGVAFATSRADVVTIERFQGSASNTVALAVASAAASLGIFFVMASK
jgi:hypothetical protein